MSVAVFIQWPPADTLTNRSNPFGHPGEDVEHSHRAMLIL